jgi:hypothetical protein
MNGQQIVLAINWLHLNIDITQNADDIHVEVIIIIISISYN